MSIVKTFLPKVLPRQYVKCEATGAFGKDSLFQCEISLEDKRISFPLHFGRLTEMQGSCGIGSAIEVLATGIAEIYCFWINIRAVAPLWLVMNDRSVWSSRRYRIKRETYESLVFAAKV
jgi:hypothetical protein